MTDEKYKDKIKASNAKDRTGPLMDSLQAIDLHNPDNNVSIGVGDMYPTQVFVKNNLVYIIDCDEPTIRICDFNDSANPKSGSRYTYKVGDFNEFNVIGNYAYIAGGEDGIEIFDISNPTNPEFVRIVECRAYSLDFNKDYLYCKNSNQSDECAISIFKIEQDDLMLITEVQIPDNSHCVISDGIAYLIISDD